MQKKNTLLEDKEMLLVRMKNEVQRNNVAPINILQ